MGAWNYGVFDDDIAYDALDDLRESLEIITDMEKYFDVVIRQSMLNMTRDVMHWYRRQSLIVCLTKSNIDVMMKITLNG